MMLLSIASAWQLLTPTVATRAGRVVGVCMKLTPAELKKEGEVVVARRAMQAASMEQSAGMVAASAGAAAADDAYDLARASWKSIVQARAMARAEWSNGAQYGGMQRGPTGNATAAIPAGRGTQDPRFATSATDMVNPGRAPGQRGVPEADTRVLGRPDWSERARSGVSLGGD